MVDVSNPQTPVLYASPSIDITKEIVELYDKSAAAMSAPAAAPKAPAAPAEAPLQRRRPSHLPPRLQPRPQSHQPRSK